MLYEPPKTKHYIIIGAAAIVLVVLLFAIFSIFQKNKTTQTPTANLPLASEQQKIQKQNQQLDKIREGSGMKNYTSEEIEQQSKKLNELRNQIVK